ncbi:heme/hemin ABC transporter substrate-binding protein [Rhabdothermincola salaria]|uniref:heme/hemin ABC transporter substrate-binding protein n=1 Tax=Rhabdothermincola salaria TaxID=2903142 RepID=UPI001E3A05D8|nr:ABC transporter substrate-binding protein [Rhabdothermincola salaria]MCD9625076.1 ABC transporter substrate-binding protein [Rhabdothermincola salaria]
MRRHRCRRLFAVAALLLAVTLGASACGAATSIGTPEGDGVELSPVATAPTPVLPAEVRSADGTIVTVTDASRILPLWGNLSEIVFALGLGDRVVGRDVSATFPGTEDLPIVTRAHDVSTESVLSLEPTVVLAQTDTGPPEALDQIRAAGIAVVVLEMPMSIDDITPRIRTIAEALGVPAAGEDLVDRTEREIADARDTIPEGSEPLVAFLYLRGQAGVYLLGGEGSGADSMIAAAGGEDAGRAIGLDRPFTPITSEAMVEAAPDVILLTGSGLESVGGIDELLAMPGIAQTPAAASRRVVTVEDGILYSFGSRTPLALAELIEAIHTDGSAS